MNLLEGIKIISLETHVAVPGATRQLADWGAQVIKIESPSGDLWRLYGSNYGLPIEDEENALFTIENANKKLVSINLKKPEGIQIVYDLLRDADAFVSNVRYASLKQIGLDYDSLKDHFPQLVYYHFSSYGYEGPKAENPGFDAAAFWAASGVLKDWSSDGDVPINMSTAFGDSIANGTVLNGLLAGLLYQKLHDGKGIRVTSSLLASSLWCNFANLVAYQPGYSQLAELGGITQNSAKLGVPFMNSYKCSDGRWVYICILEYRKGVKKALPLLGLEDMAADPRIQTLIGFMFNNAEFYPKIINAFAQKTSDEWIQIFSDADLVIERIAQGAEAVKNEQAIANGYVSRCEFDTHNSVMLPNPPTHFFGVDTLPTKSAGGIGENTSEVLRELGYSEEKIAYLKDTGVVVAKD